MLRDCIKTDLECAEICGVTARILALNGDFQKDIVRLCQQLCEACAEECEKHAGHGMEHCEACAKACRACAEACKKLVA
ncbi:four-helix bundle copper-binding protein [Sphingobacterium lactis]|nr:four-helix bundle copper-binding protein [Sphingobacterium lactis]